jgi:hypothetical protein
MKAVGGGTGSGGGLRRAWAAAPKPVRWIGYVIAAFALFAALNGVIGFGQSAGEVVNSTFAKGTEINQGIARRIDGIKINI